MVPSLEEVFPPNPFQLLRNHSHQPPAIVATSVLVPTPIGNTRVQQPVWSPTSTESGLTKHSEARSSASPSTSVLAAVNGAPLVSTTIPARSVATPPMVGLIAGPDSIFPIVTKLKAEALEFALGDAGILNEFADIPVGLRQGFLCGLEHFTLAHTFIPPNHFTSQDDEDFIISKYSEELSLGRISHGYDPDTLSSLIRHYRTAPLAVISNGGDKHCVIVNHLFPKNKPCIDLDKLPHDSPGM